MLGFVNPICVGSSFTDTVVDPPPANVPLLAERVHPVVGIPLPLIVPCHVNATWPILLRANVGHALAVQMPCSVQVVPLWQTYGPHDWLVWQRGLTVTRR